MTAELVEWIQKELYRSARESIEVEEEALM
jgi:hypothetical protein